MKYEQFFDEIHEMGLSANEELTQPYYKKDSISIWDVKEKRCLCTIDTSIHHVFEFHFEMPQEYWEGEEAEKLIDFVVALAKTPIDERGSVMNENKRQFAGPRFFRGTVLKNSD